MNLSPIVTFCYLLSLTPIVIGGLVYTIMKQYMPYHEIATGLAWDQLEPGIQTLLLASLNANGALMLCIGLAMSVLLAIPYRRNEQWANYTISILGCLAMLAGLRSALLVDQLTPADPPWPLFIIVIILLLIAALLTPFQKNKNKA